VRAHSPREMAPSGFYGSKETRRAEWPLRQFAERVERAEPTVLTRGSRSSPPSTRAAVATQPTPPCLVARPNGHADAFVTQRPGRSHHEGVGQATQDNPVQARVSEDTTRCADRPDARARNPPRRPNHPHAARVKCAVDGAQENLVVPELNV